MATIAGKFLKKAGKSLKAVAKVAKKAAPLAIGAAGAAFGLGVISAPLAAKVGAVLNRTKVGAMVNKVVQTGVVVNSKIKKTLKKGGVTATDSEVNEISKSLADRATRKTNKTIIRDKKSQTTRESTDNRVQQIERLKMRKAQVESGDGNPTELEKISAKVATLASSLQGITDNPAIDRALQTAQDVATAAPAVAAAAVQMFQQSGISPSMDGEVSFPKEVKEQLYTEPLKPEANKAGFNPLYIVYAAIAAAVIYMFTVMNKKK